jgi:hypothetical protein
LQPVAKTVDFCNIISLLTEGTLNEKSKKQRAPKRRPVFAEADVQEDGAV